MSLYLICDEAGEKGWSTNQEKVSGEFGVFAGLLLNDQQYLKYLDLVKDIKRRFFTGIEKVHITDAPLEDKALVREEIYNFVKSEGVPCIYEGVYVQGYYDSNKRLDDLRMQSVKEAEKQGDLKINSRSIKERLHVDLFEGLFNKALAFYEDHHAGEPFIVITDNVDKPIEQEFERVIKHLVSLGDTTEIVAKGFIPSEKKAVKTSETIKGALGSFSVKMENGYVDLRVEAKENAIGSDVVASSLDFHIKEEINENLIDLNGPEAIKNHPLKDNFIFVENGYFGDVDKQHPDSNTK
ncbi:hypothetical protein SCOR_10170 [Sulfidibacter corallicola]|uniref:DUF3800 domain-containing protein n=1 Tax=Sulfidibacter corallicola TaxID=2818388 RepID=A0A8A4TDW3_SULCO|nr:hypothetical protein [Sulfidibacter corallicola]QTD48289.1 hypothetical protein J3U87_22145 [Sulfidibacter corallicola]